MVNAKSGSIFLLVAAIAVFLGAAATGITVICINVMTGVAASAGFLIVLALLLVGGGALLGGGLMLKQKAAKQG